MTINMVISILVNFELNIKLINIVKNRNEP